MYLFNFIRKQLIFFSSRKPTDTVEGQLCPYADNIFFTIVYLFISLLKLWLSRKLKFSSLFITNELNAHLKLDRKKKNPCFLSRSKGFLKKKTIDSALNTKNKKIN